MEEESRLLSRLQNRTAVDVITQRYDYLVRHVNAIRILPHLVSSRLVEPYFSEYLDHERTDKGKMMALLQELLRSPMEGWFKEFVSALSRFPQYQTVVDTLLAGKQYRDAHMQHAHCHRQLKCTLLCVDFTRLMEERLAHPSDNGEEGM